MGRCVVLAVPLEPTDRIDQEEVNTAHPELSGGHESHAGRRGWWSGGRYFKRLRRRFLDRIWGLRFL